MAKNDNNNDKRVVLYNSYDDTTTFDDVARELADAGELQYHDEYGDYTINEVQHIEAIMQWQAQDLWEDAMAQVATLFKGKYVLVAGTVGRWDGTYAGGKYLGLYDNDGERGVCALLESCDYIKIEATDKAVYITGAHHDGTNHFELYALDDVADTMYDDWQYSRKYNNLTEQAMHQKMLQHAQALDTSKLWQ